MMSRNPNAASILSDLLWTCFWEPGTFAKDLVEAPESLKTLPQFAMDGDPESPIARHVIFWFPNKTPSDILIYPIFAYHIYIYTWLTDLNM